jgi:hypothetical protein
LKWLIAETIRAAILSLPASACHVESQMFTSQHRESRA